MAEDDLRTRLTNNLEPVLELPDPRSKISAYHDMPYAIFRYEPTQEWALRREISLLETRLKNRGKRVHRVSLAECLTAAMASQGDVEAWCQIEVDTDLQKTIDTLHELLASVCPLVDLVADRLPSHPDPLTDVIFLVRTGALFPVYRTFSLLEQLKGRVIAPTVLFYPGTLDGAAGLRFMSVLPAEHNYRPKIY